MYKFRLLLTVSLVCIIPCVSEATPPEVDSIEVIIGSKYSVPADDEMSPLSSPFGVDFDQAGNMFIAELYGGHLYKYSADKTLKTIGGNGDKGYAGDGGPVQQAVFNGMHNLAISKSEMMYIADTFNHCVRAVDLKTRTIQTIIGTGTPGFSGDEGPAAHAQFHNTMCVTLNHAETILHIADLNNRRIRAVDLKTMFVTTVAGNGKKGIPKDGALATDSPLVDPRAVASDELGNIYVLERNGNALRKVDLTGKITTIAGSGKKGFLDGPALLAEFGDPKHLCVDSQGRVYIADDMNKAIRCYDPATETVSTLLGRGQGNPPLELKRPHGVCIEGKYLFVVDTEHHRIIQLTLSN